MNAGLLSSAATGRTIKPSIAFGLLAVVGAGLLYLLLAAAPVPTAQAQGEAGKVLMYTGTTGYRHGGGQAIDPAAVTTMIGAIEDAGYDVDYRTCFGADTDPGDGNPAANHNNQAQLVACQNPDFGNPATFTPANLEQYDAIYLHSASDFWTGASGWPGAPGTEGQLFNAAQRQAIIEFVQNGGGIAGSHNITDAGSGNTVTWDWWDGDGNSVVGTRMGSHAETNINNVAQVQVADRNHLSTRDLPDQYGFGDEHYNYFTNVRGTHHVLATLDERTYNVTGNPTGRQDHPISWCKLYDGDNVDDGTGNPKPYNDGRAWVTGMGHFAASYTQNGGDNELVNHIVGGIRWVAGEGLKSDCSGTDWSSFERTTLVDNANNGPISLDVAADGKVFWTEIGSQGPWPNFNSNGYVKMHDPNGAPNNSTVVATIPTRADHGNSEDGVLGMSLEPGFDVSDPDKRDIYVYYSPRGDGEDPPWPTSGSDWTLGYNLISRFTLNGQGTAFVPDSEQEILRVDKVKIAGSPTINGFNTGSGPGHVGGASLVFDADGNLVLGVGDDVSPNHPTHQNSMPTDYRQIERRDARKTSANTGDLRGKLVRIKPIDGASGEPGVGTTYEVPETNMFAGDSDPLTRPEIFAMGFRQPFTVHADPENPDTVVVGEYCHDNTSNVAQRAPAGTCEWNLVDEPGFHGWPFCVGNNSEINTGWRWQYANSGSGSPTGEQYDCSASEIPSDLDWAPDGHTNGGVSNEGAETIPGPAKQATIWNKYPGAAGGESQMDFGNLNVGGKQPITGPIYRHSETSAQGAFPAYYDGSWLIANRGSAGGFWKEVRLRQDNNEMLRVHDFMPDNQFGGQQHSLVIGTRFGPDGALYMARYPVGCCRDGTNPSQNVQIFKIESTVVDECLEDDFAPNVSHQIDGQPHPTLPDTYVVNYQAATLTITANDVGCAGVDTVEYRIGDGDWEEYDGAIDFPDAGEFDVDYRATDRMDNTSDVGTASFTAVEVDDTDAPEVDASLSGPQDADGNYRRATLTIDAADEISPISSIEYSTDGGDNWTTETFDDGAYDDGYSESLEVEFEDEGEYSVSYRATDAADNTSDAGVEEFAIVRSDVCVGPRSDEFDGAELDSKWQLLRSDPSQDEPSVSGGNLILPLGAFSVDLDRPGPITMLGQELPDEDFTVEAKIEAPGLGNDDTGQGSVFAQVGFKLFQGNDDWVKVVQTRQPGTPGDTYFEMAYENGGSRTLGPQMAQAPTRSPFWLQITRTGDAVTGAYATQDPDQGGTWNDLGNPANLATIFDPADGPVHIGPYGGNGSIDATYEYIRFTPDEGECPETCGASDEFDGPDLDPKWNVRVEDGEPAIDDGQLVLPILDEIDGTATGPLALVSQQVPEGDWSLTTRVTPELESSWAQAGIMLWQSDGNFVKYVFGRNEAGTQHRVEIASDDPIDQRETAGGAVGVDMGIETMWLRLIREGTVLRGEYAPDDGGEPGEWVEHPKELAVSGVQPVNGRTIDPPREGEGVQLGLYGGSDIEGAPYEQAARFDFARFDPDEDCPDPGEDTTPPVTTDSLDPAEPGAGGTYDGPVDVTLSATDPGGDGGSEPANHDVQAVGTAWEPDELDIEFGDQVTWHAEPVGLSHDVNVIAPGEAPDSEGTKIGDLPAGGDPVDTVFNEAGTWRFYCEPHSFPTGGAWQGMVGTVEVGEASGGGGGEPSGVDFTEYRVNTDGDTGDWVQSDNVDDADPFETQFTVSDDGDHEVEYRSVDNAGNEEETKSVEFSIEGDDDVTPPVTTHMLVPPEPGDGGTYDGMVRIVFTANDEDGGSGVDFTEYRVNGGDWEMYNPMMPPEFTDNGDYEVEYRSVDNAGNVEDPPGSVGFSIEIDGAGSPEIEVLARPASRTVGPKRKQVNYRFRATNVGDGTASVVNMCAKAPAKRAKVRGQRCRQVTDLEPGASNQEVFKIRIKNAARGTVSRIRFVARGPEFAKQKAAVRLKVRR